MASDFSEKLKNLKPILSKYGIAFILVGMVIIMTILKPESFPSGNNILNILNQSAIVGVMALGMTLVIISKGIDLSVGSVLALAGTVAASLAQTREATIQVFENLGPQPIIVPILAAVGIGALSGMISGSLIAFTGIPAFISTLGMMTVARGVVFLYTQGQPVSKLSEGILFFGSKVFDVVPVPIIVYGIMIIITAIILGYTRFGKSVYAIGGNSQSARLSGIPVARSRMMVFVICAMLAGFAGIMESSRPMIASPTGAEGYELEAIAACVIGGASLMGGEGTVIGAIAGTLIMQVLVNLCNLLNIETDWQKILVGALVIILVAYDTYRKRRSGLLKE